MTSTQFGCGVEKKTLKRTQELIIIFLDLQVRPHIINKAVFSHFQRIGRRVGYTSLWFCAVLSVVSLHYSN